MFTAGGHEICGPGKVPPPRAAGMTLQGSSSAQRNEEEPVPEQEEEDAQSDADDVSGFSDFTQYLGSDF